MFLSLNPPVLPVLQGFVAGFIHGVTRLSWFHKQGYVLARSYQSSHSTSRCCQLSDQPEPYHSTSRRCWLGVQTESDHTTSRRCKASLRTAVYHSTSRNCKRSVRAESVRVHVRQTVSNRLNFRSLARASFLDPPPRPSWYNDEGACDMSLMTRPLVFIIVLWGRGEVIRGNRI